MKNFMTLTRKLVWKAKFVVLSVGLIISLILIHFTNLSAKAAQFASTVVTRTNGTIAAAKASEFFTADIATSSALPSLLVGGCEGSFVQAPSSTISAGQAPQSVVVGDFNLDGKPDFAVANGVSNNVTISLGVGNGSFTPAVGSPVGVGINPTSVAAGDFNLDGKLDLAVTNRDSANVTILLGSGNGGFTQAVGSPIVAGGLPRSVVVGDFNIDGKPDIAIANIVPGNVTILLGNGSGGFAPASGSPITVGVGSQDLVIGDFNLDGKPDLAVSISFANKVTILLGDGNGGFTPTAASPITVGTFPRGMSVGDFNLDGRPDLAVANVQSNNVIILLGNGNGGFAPATGSPISVGADPVAVGLGDFNGDGKPDLAVVNDSSYNVTILKGNGSGGFTKATGSPISVGAEPLSLAVGDFNLDGKPDFAVANFRSDNVTVQLNTCDAQPCSGIAFSQPAGSPIAGANILDYVAVGDFNLDGKPDLAVVNEGFGNVAILLGQGGGSFTQAVGSPIGTGLDPASVTVGDFNLDGKPDLAVANYRSNNVTVLLGNGSGGFVQAASSPVSGVAAPQSIVTGDFNLDGNPDLATANLAFYSVTILLGNGKGGFAQPVNLPDSQGGGSFSLAVGDFNLDGKPDLAVADQGLISVKILLGDGSGGFVQAVGSPVGVGSVPRFVAVADFNLDGKPDIVVGNYGSASITILLGNGLAGFTPAAGSPVGTGTTPRFVAVGDFNLDGKPDLAVANFGSDNLTILLGNGSGGFTQAAGSPVRTGTGPYSVAVRDFNLDGKPDIAVANLNSSNVTILLNTCTPPNTPPTISTTPITRTTDGSSANSQIATVGDAQDALNTLSMKVNGGASATVNGVTVSNITVDAAGIVRADVVAAANATNASFTLRVTDSGGLFAEATLNVTVVGFSIKLTDPAVCLGQGGVVGVIAQVTNPNAAQVTASFTATPDANLLALSGTCVVNVGTCSVDKVNNKVNWTGSLNTGQTVTISYQTQVADTVANGTTVCVTSTASFNAGPPASITACTKLNCPSAGPGALPLAASPSSDQKPGSVLVYNLYTSGATDANAQNARIALTNTHQSLSTPVHLFFVDGSSCSVADNYVCLTPNQTTTFLASDIDPGTSGYLIAVAADQNGCPRNFNYLIGDEYVKLSSGHAANLGAESFAALAGGLPLCDMNSTTVAMNFDGVSYNQAPRVLAVDNLPSHADGNDTQLVLNRFGGNLATGASTLGTIFGILYNDSENALSFSVSGSCQLRGSLSNNFPRTTPRFESFISAGRSGWIKLYSQTDLALLGAVINFNPNAGTQANAFNQGHNLHKLTLTSSAVLTIPVFPPSC